MDKINENDLSNLVKDIQPSIVTPKLSEITNANNEKKIKLVARIIVKNMAENYNNNHQYKVPRYIMHNNESIAVRYLNVEPLMTGVWPAMSLCLLNLSYGEQTTLIEALYPKTTQLAAKEFAVIFASPTKHNKSNHEITVHESDDVMTKMDSANAGIAMILAILNQKDDDTNNSHGDKTKPHPDDIHLNLVNMQALVKEAHKSNKFKQQSKRAHDANQFRDH